VKKDYIMRISSDIKSEKNEMGGTRRYYTGEERCMQDFGWEN
jgi:hypothetical protein